MSPRSVVTAVLALAVAGAATTATATMPLQKKAKEAGFPAANCQYCHADKLPKKGAATLNERGKFLASQKDKQKAADVDVAWLKDYKEAAK